MRFREFEQRAHEYWAEIPDEYRRGIDGVRVLRRAKAHDELPDVYTMGECVTEAYPSEYGSAETTRSAVVLYHGSFAALADLDPAFDWEEELWETLTHELQHHLESLAREDALEDFDYAADENFKRYEGQAFDPTFYRGGARTGQLASLRIDGTRDALALESFRVDADWFFELVYSPARPPSGRVTFEWAGARHAFELPLPRRDVTFLVLGESFEPEPLGDHAVDEVCIVLVRRAGLLRGIVDALRGRPPSVEHVEIEVSSSGGEPGE